MPEHAQTARSPKNSAVALSRAESRTVPSLSLDNHQTSADQDSLPSVVNRSPLVHAMTQLRRSIGQSPYVISQRLQLQGQFAESARQQPRPAEQIQMKPEGGVVPPARTGNPHPSQVIQKFDETDFAQLVLALGVVAAYALYRNWPAGRAVRDIFTLIYHAGPRGALSFAYMAGWNSASVIALATDYGVNNNALTAADWVGIATNLPPNSPVDAAAFARIAGWNFPAINQLSQDHVAGNNGFSVQQWTAIAGMLPANAHAEATVFARIPAWGHPAIVALIGDFIANPAGKTAAQWAGMAANIPPAARPVVAELATHAMRPIGDQQRAAQIYAASGNSIARVQGWIAGGWRAPVGPMAPMPGLLAGPPPAPVLDGVLGVGTHANIRALIILHGRPYVVNPFVVNHARTLIAAGASVADTVTLLTDFCTNIALAADFDTAVDVARRMLLSNIPVAEIRIFINNHAAQALGAPFQPAITDLVTRTEVTGARLGAVLGILGPLANPGMINFLNARFPVTPGLTLRRIELRLGNFTQPVPAGGQNIAIGNVGAEFQAIDQSLNQRVANHTMSANGQTWMERAFRLLTGATRAQMLAFLGDARVNGTFANAQATNAAFWLYQFARLHQRAPAGGFAPVNVVVPAGGANQTVVIDDWIIEHVQERHTYEHYRLIPAIINRPGGVSTIINPPTTAAAIAAAIQGVLGNAAVAGAWHWAHQPIIVGAVQLRIGMVPGRGGGNFVLSQYYYYAAPGLGDVVPAAALNAIRQRFPYLVY